MKKQFISATSLKILLVMFLLSLTILSFGGFYYIQDTFRNRAADLNLSSDTQTEAPISKTNLITVSKDSYIQTITKDLNAYTTYINPNMIQSYDMSGAAFKEAAFMLTDINTQPITVVLKNPVKYTELIQFIKAVETNLPKISIKNLNIKDDLVSDEYVEVEPIVIEVYTK